MIATRFGLPAYREQEPGLVLGRTFAAMEGDFAALVAYAAAPPPA